MTIDVTDATFNAGNLSNSGTITLANSQLNVTTTLCVYTTGTDPEYHYRVGGEAPENGTFVCTLEDVTGAIDAGTSISVYTTGTGEETEYHCHLGSDVVYTSTVTDSIAAGTEIRIYTLGGNDYYQLASEELPDGGTDVHTLTVTDSIAAGTEIRIYTTVRFAGWLIRPLKPLKRLRIPARSETRFRDGTVQWSCGKIPVAARGPSGRTKYLAKTGVRTRCSSVRSARSRCGSRPEMFRTGTREK